MYVIRSKGPKIRIRDGKSGEVKAVTAIEWVVFDELPKGMTVHGSPSSEVREIKCDADLESVIAENARMAEEYAARHKPKLPPEPEPISEESTPAPGEAEPEAEPQPAAEEPEAEKRGRGRRRGR